VCLVKIKQSPEGLNSTELSHICDIDKAFVSRITTYLIKEDLIKINEKFNDGRKYKHKYILTEKANVMMEDIIQSIVYAFSIVTENIPKEELMTFYRVLNAFNDNIESAVDSVLN
jgi:DNA-binding MarR family transcriptional regulator